jgi:hypothetical protein
MDAAFFKTVGLAVFALIAVLAVAYGAKEEFDLRRNRGATISQAVVQTIWSYVVMELLATFAGGILIMGLVIGIGVGFVGLMIMGWREVIEIITSLDNAKP